jgi:hypothetical protein
MVCRDKGLVNGRQFFILLKVQHVRIHYCYHTIEFIHMNDPLRGGLLCLEVVVIQLACGSVL